MSARILEVTETDLRKNENGKYECPCGSVEFIQATGATKGRNFTGILQCVNCRKNWIVKGKYTT